MVSPLGGFHTAKARARFPGIRVGMPQVEAWDCCIPEDSMFMTEVAKWLENDAATRLLHL